MVVLPPEAEDEEPRPLQEERGGQNVSVCQHERKGVCLWGGGLFDAPAYLELELLPELPEEPVLPEDEEDELPELEPEDEEEPLPDVEPPLLELPPPPLPPDPPPPLRFHKSESHDVEGSSRCVCCCAG